MTILNIMIIYKPEVQYFDYISMVWFTPPTVKGDAGCLGDIFAERYVLVLRGIFYVIYLRESKKLYSRKCYVNTRYQNQA